MHATTLATRSFSGAIDCRWITLGEMDGSSFAIPADVNITEQFNELLRQHRAPPVVKKVSLEDIDSFLQEAYRIVSHSSLQIQPDQV